MCRSVVGWGVSLVGLEGAKEQGKGERGLTRGKKDLNVVIVGLVSSPEIGGMAEWVGELIVGRISLRGEYIPGTSFAETGATPVVPFVSTKVVGDSL